MNNELHSSPHIQRQRNVTQIMLAVIYALLPGMLAYIYFFGWGLVINLLIAITTAQDIVS